MWNSEVGEEIMGLWFDNGKLGDNSEKALVSFKRSACRLVNEHGNGIVDFLPTMRMHI